MRVLIHPTLGIACREDGAVCVRSKGGHRKFHWTYGSLQKTGYYSIGYKSKHYYIHRLIAETFLDNPSKLPSVDHLNRIRTDNRLENLRWASWSDQLLNARLHLEVVARHGAMRVDSSKYHKEDYARRKAAGFIYHHCCDGKTRWHLPGMCPVSENGAYHDTVGIYYHI